MTDYLDRTPSNYKIVQSQIWAWGNAQAGALGNDTSGTNISSPVLVAGGYTDWKTLSGGYHSVGVRYNGSLFVWGYNRDGQLGDSTTSNKSSPIQIGADTTWDHASVGYAHSAAIKTNGTLWSWGNNTWGQCATNDVTHRSSPVQEVLANTTWKAVACGWYHTVALRRDGTLWSWGQNSDGQLGKNDVVHRSSPVQELTGNTDWKIISAGGYHTAGIKTDGTLWLWGDGSNGRLGQFSTQVDRSSPVQTVFGGSNWSAISLGKHHNLALKTDGTLWAWGRGTDGQLGSGAKSSASSPIQDVTNGTDWKSVCAFGWSSAALKTDGSMWTWGDGSTGELGNEDFFDEPVPVEPSKNIHTWKSLNSSCAGETLFAFEDISSDVVSGQMATFNEPELWLWGVNTVGALGDNTQTHRSSPIQTTSGGINWKLASSSRYHTAAIKTDGTLWAWGDNSNGQLGDNTTTHRSSPVQTVSGGTNWKKVAVGREFTAAIKTDFTLWTWGDNAYGQLGDNSTIVDKSSPVQEATLNSTWRNLSCGQWHALAIRNNGTLWAWGHNEFGQIGNNTNNAITRISSPVQEVLLGTNWKEVSAGAFHSAGIRADGTLWTWGLNTDGQLGKNDVTHRSSPVQEALANTYWKSVSCGGYHTLGLQMNGSLWVWGKNTTGQLGDNSVTRKSTPVQTVSGGTNWKIIAGGLYHSAAIKTDGTLWTWGINDMGQLGDNSVTHRSSPIQSIAGGSNWKNIFGSAYALIVPAIKDAEPLRATNGLVTQEYLIDVYPSLSQQFKQAGLWGWGDNTNGELGDGTIIHRSSPVQTLAGGTNWITGSSGFAHTAMIKSNGTLWSWGRGGSGQLGDNTNGTKKSSPVQEILASTLWKTVSVGRYHTAAVRTDGTLWAWGLNANGQLGKNDVTHRSSPVQEVLAATTWKTVSSGTYHSVALRTDGTLWAWGFNSNGQLGKNDVTQRSSPVQEVLAATTWKTVACGAYHSAALRTDGTLWLWGRNTSGQLAKNDVVHRSSPVQELTSGTTWTMVSGGAYHTTAIKGDGTLWAWGTNNLGQLGNATSGNAYSSPIQTVSGGTNWKQVLAGQNYTVALKTDGSLWAWGHNNYGQLGMSDNVHRSSPTQVGSSYNWIKLFGENRFYRTYAIRDDSEDTL